ncbi:hypothetical protein HFD88_007517 [Aspergillus terreus]|nr:hypothetical protein HFD88_007517 [Aspergillus terreus]
MLVLQGSNFITSIVIGLLLLLSPVSSIADVGFCDYSNINEPIGIDLGYQYIAASYANSSTLFTPLAVVNNAEYTALVSQLAAEDFERSDLKSLFGNRDGSAYALLKVITSRLTSKLTAKIPYINHPYVEFITGTTSQVYVSLATQFQRLIDTALRRSQERPKPLTLSGISETFIRVFQDLQASAIADIGTKLSFAVIGIPDFFNETMIVVDASRKAGIETPSHALPRSLLTHFENPTIREGATVLVLHQGVEHCGIRVYFEGGSGSSSSKSSRRRNATKKTLKNPATRDAYLRLDPWRSEIIHRRLTESLIRSNQELQTQLEVGADRHVLVACVAQARLQLKRQDVSVVYLGTESRSADFYNTIAENSKGEYLEDVPLELDKWWLYGSNPGVKLTREMVLAADEEYVKGLANTINFFLRATQGLFTSSLLGFYPLASH